MSSPRTFRLGFPSRQVACALVASLLVLRAACEFDSETKLFKVPELPTLHNWAGNVVFQAKGVRTPHHISELVDIVKSNDYVRVMGARHSFSEIGDSQEVLVALDHMSEPISFSKQTKSVTIQGGTTYQHLAEYLVPHGYALDNVASLMDFTVAGAVSTGTHGSGAQLGVLATQLLGMQLVQADGQILSLHAERKPEPYKAGYVDDLKAAAVGLGAFGVIATMELKVVPTYQVELCIYADVKLPAENLQWEFLNLVERVYSISLYTDFKTMGTFTHVFIRHNLNGTHHPTTKGCTADLFGSPPLPRAPPLSPSMADPSVLTPPGVGPWHQKLPLFKTGALGHEGHELQSEYFVPRTMAAAAMQAVAGMYDTFKDVLVIAEVRVVAADDLWMSPAYKRASAALHFTWTPDEAAVRAVLPVLERALMPFDPRPHWAKLFTMPPDKVRLRYKDKVMKMNRWFHSADPHGKFHNAFVDRYMKWGKSRSPAKKTAGSGHGHSEL